MKNFYLILIAVCLITFSGCKEEEVVDNTPKMGLEVTVWNATNRTPENPNAVVSPNATVYVFTSVEDVAANKPAYTGKTNANGVFTISVPLQQEYYVTAVNGNAKATKNGLLINGIFINQEQINHSPAQTPAAQVGDLIFADINGDGIVSDPDKRSYRIFSTYGATTVITVIKDKIIIAE